MHEGQMHQENSFITLTYDEQSCPTSLEYSDFQRFMYRVRAQCGPTRFFACGEYGSTTLRPHFHAILFGLSFHDGVPCGKDLYASADLSKLWPHGFSSFGQLSYQSASYVAGYCLKKMSGPKADAHYLRVDRCTGEFVHVAPEMGHMSLKPGIGYSWFQRYWREVYGVRDGVVLQGGKMVPSPRYYDKLLESTDEDLSERVAFDRYVKSKRFSDDTSDERLLVRETVVKARMRQKESVL